MASSSKSFFKFEVLSMAQHLPHSLQLSLLVLIGRLELLHPLCQVLHLRLLPLPELSAPQPGLTVRRQQPQPQQLDARLDSCRETEREGNLMITRFTSTTIRL